MWVMSGAADFLYTAAHLDAYEETHEWLTFITSFGDMHHPCVIAGLEVSQVFLDTG